MSVFGAVLAAGSSARLGQPKQVVAFGGTPLVRRAASACCDSGCAKVGVVVGAYWAAVVASLDGLPVEVIHGVDFQEGMAASIRAATSWAIDSGARALLLSVCDQPRLGAKHLRALLDASGDGARLAASYYADKLAVPAVFPERYFAALLALRGDVGAASVLREGRDVARISWPDGAIDLDTPADLPGANVRAR